MLLTTLMKDFGRFAGLPELEPDEDGSYYLMFDDLVIIIRPASLLPDSASEKRDGALLYACAGLLPRAGREQACLQLLGANLRFAGTDGATLSIDDDLVYLQRGVPLSGLDLTDFLPMLESFVQKTEDWTRFCASASPVVTPDSFAPAEQSAIVPEHRV